jgi:single-strand DNA-binding protein
MPNFNKIVLVGNLTRDWEVRKTQGGMAVGKTGIAVNRKSREKEETMFVDVVAFGQVAETLSKHTGKGRPLLVEGRLSLQQWEDKDGKRRSKHEVVLDSFQFMGKSEDREESSPFQSKNPHDIPF